VGATLWCDRSDPAACAKCEACEGNCDACSKCPSFDEEEKPDVTKPEDELQTKLDLKRQQPAGLPFDGREDEMPDKS